MIILEKHETPDGIQKTRLVDYAFHFFKNLPSRSALKKAIKRGEVMVNEMIANSATWIEAGQTIMLIDLEKNPPKSFELSLDVVFEDDFLAIVNKPAGIPVSGNMFKTIQNALTFNLEASTVQDALKWPRPVHRLDVPTSGLLIIAKTASAVMQLGKQLENKEVEKRYRAIVAGKLPELGTIDSPVKGQDALTKYECVKHIRSLKTGWLSLVDLFPLTGRTHQLRIHMAEHGNPIVGDKNYGTALPLLKGKGLFLCAVGLSFIHPELENPVKVKISQPAKFDTLIERESTRWKKYY